MPPRQVATLAVRPEADARRDDLQEPTLPDWNENLARDEPVPGPARKMSRPPEESRKGKLLDESYASLNRPEGSECILRARGIYHAIFERPIITLWSNWPEGLRAECDCQVSG